MSLRHPTLDALIVSVHSAALSPDGWDRLGQLLLRTFSAEQGIGLRVGSKEHPEPWAVLLNFDHSAAALYAKDWAPHDVWYHGAVGTGRLTTGLVSVGGQLISDSDFESSPFFNDYLKPLDIGHMIQVCLLGSHSDDIVGKHAALSLYRGVNGAPFSAEDRLLLSQLAPHLGVAAKNHWAAHALRLLSGARRHALDAVTSGVFAINHHRQVFFSNRLGEEMLRRSHWVRLVKGMLEPLPHLIGANEVANSLKRLSFGIGAAMLITDPTTREQAHMSMSTVPEGAEVGDRLTAPTSLVWITPVVPRRNVGDDMGRLFDLTPAERRLVDHFVAIQDLHGAAAALQISIHTARTQLKSIFHKTGRRNQRELLLLAIRMASLYPCQPH